VPHVNNKEIKMKIIMVFLCMFFITGTVFAQEPVSTPEERAINYFKTDPRFLKIMVAFSDIIKDEINLVRGWTRDFKTEAAAATSLADFQARIATLPTLEDRTLQQLRNALEDRIITP